MRITEHVDGQPLPLRLEANASETWNVIALSVARDDDALIGSKAIKPHSTWPSQFRFMVAGGNGKSANTQDTFDSLRLIADAARGES